jgi:hypothetical protein
MRVKEGNFIGDKQTGDQIAIAQSLVVRSGDAVGVRRMIDLLEHGRTSRLDGEEAPDIW